MPLVDVGPVQFVPFGLKLMPLDARVEDVQDIVKDLVEGEFGLRAFGGLLEVGGKVAVELSTADLGGNMIIEELFLGLSIGLGAHSNVPS